MLLEIGELGTAAEVGADEEIEAADHVYLKMWLSLMKIVKLLHLICLIWELRVICLLELINVHEVAGNLTIDSVFRGWRPVVVVMLKWTLYYLSYVQTLWHVGVRLIALVHHEPLRSDVDVVFDYVDVGLTMSMLG